MNFTYLFYQHIIFRHSCGKCHFCNTTRPSDITIADFWGWEKTDPEFGQDNKGVSLVLVNTPKGREIFEAVKDKLNTIPAELDNCLQPNLQHPTKLNSQSEKFVQDYERYGYEYVLKKYSPNIFQNYLHRIKKRIINFLKKK